MAAKNSKLFKITDLKEKMRNARQGGITCNLAHISLHKPRTQFYRIYSWTAWSLKTGPVGCSETSARNCRYTLRNIPEECRSHAIKQLWTQPGNS
jgi:hypothetical protein